ncbi:MAG: tetratricopeptide repeat protein [Candidatus Pseudobacter hemicellulosilyticus]|uniref:Tetratricopeptide repeat protein n=1 Tax=Candidatus Pseudobacter hemicellulosilyticus TaxID=3121375 RepID=A0AAJ6BH07_9BACT|nr:MAG: tetratricopeptide repeat protein [Pseudobacter sp.]
MKKIVFAVGFLVAAGIAAAQEDSKSLQETAKNFMRQGDYSNAILVLNRALQKDGDNLELKKDLAFSYYLHRDYVRALEVAKPFAERADADVPAYQILGMIYKGIEERKECEKMYKAALKKYPNSGVLYNEYGEMLWSKNDFKEAIKLFEKGIEVDPNFSGNYYNAAKYYFFATDKVWSLIYGEIFVNLESYSKRTPEIKSLLLDSYKKLFTDADLSKGQDTKNEFVRLYLEGMKNQSGFVASNGITPETLSAIRTKFLVDWMARNNTRHPFRLFEYQQQLLKGGMFDAYNEWIFGVAGNLPVYESWIRTHPEEHKQFEYFQKNRVFKLPPTGQYYQTSK